MNEGVRRIELGPLPADGLRLRLEKIRWTDRSFQVLAFLNLPRERWDTADLRDPCYADAFFMYGAGARAEPERDVYLTGRLKIRRSLVEKVGRSDRNDLILITQDVDGRRLHEDLLEVADLVVES